MDGDRSRLFNRLKKGGGGGGGNPQSSLSLPRRRGDLIGNEKTMLALLFRVCRSLLEEHLLDCLGIHLAFMSAPLLALDTGHGQRS